MLMASISTHLIVIIPSWVTLSVIAIAMAFTSVLPATIKYISIISSTTALMLVLIFQLISGTLLGQ